MNLLAPAFEDPTFRWDERKARHLVERGGFGLPPSAARRLAAMPMREAINALVDYERYPDRLAAPDWLPEERDMRAERERLRGLSEEERRRQFRERQRAEREAMVRLQRWWLDRMLRTERPLEEKMTLFWHGHFAVSAQKVRSSRFNYELNEIFRRHATGNFGQLLRAVGKSPAMLDYLDNRTSKKTHPNENWARELFELFALGEGHYTERDIKEAARAFTGWTVRGGKFAYAAAWHDDGIKTIFGRQGRFDGDAVIDLVLEQPSCAEHICAKLWRFFAYEDPEPEVVSGLARTLRESRYELKPVLRQMFSSKAFYSERSLGSQIKSPTQFLVEALGQLGAEVPERPPVAQLALRAMGQDLFYPPNVKGWDGGRAWVSTNSVLVRCQLMAYLLTGQAPSLGGGGRGQGRAERRILAASVPGEEPAMMMAGKRGELDGDTTSQDAMPADNAVRAFLLALAGLGGDETTVGRRAPFDAASFFAPYLDWTPEQVVETLAQYFLAVPLSARQKAVLTETLQRGAPHSGERLVLRAIPEADRVAMLYLLLSTAEYNLC